MRFRRVVTVVFIAVLVASVAPAAQAADAEDIASQVADTGVYVEPGVGVSATRLSTLVATVRNEGEAVNYVVLADEPSGGATTFADAVFRRIGEGVVVVVTPVSVGWSGLTEVFTDAEFDDAVDVSLDGATDEEVLELFTAALTGAPIPTAPETPQDAPESVDAPASSSGGGSGWLWLLVIGGGIVLFFVWRSRQNKMKGPRLDPRLADAKRAVQGQIADVANDIIDMEDEVRSADNAQVDEFYEAAGRTYNDVTEAVERANTPEALLELSNELDEAIWQLDSAEALLDGKPPPLRPQPKRLPTAEPTAQPSTGAEGSSSMPPRPSYPDYDRRPTRRSSPVGGGLMDILIGMAGTMMAGRSRGGGLLGGLGGGSSRGRRVPTPQFPQVPRSGSPVPSPSRPGRSASSSRRTSSTRRGTTGRGRGGGRRRRG